MGGAVIKGEKVGGEKRGKTVVGMYDEYIN